MGKSTQYGMWGRYSAVPPTLASGDTGALQVTSSGALKTTTSLPVGIRPPTVKMKYGQPGRHTNNAVTLQDGDEVAILVDVNGNAIIGQ